MSSRVAGLLDRLQELALRLDSRRVLIAIGTIIVLLGVLDVLELVFGSPVGIFDLNGERNVPATLSAALWTCVSVVALLLGRAEQPAAVARVWQVLSALLLYIAADEFGEIHERLERITGVDWQILYAPLGLVAAGLWVLVGRRLRGLRAGFGLFVGGTVCAVVSQMIEEVEYGANDQRVSAFDELVVGEEVLEMLAAVFVGLAFLAALRAVCRQTQA